jgi:prepilin-type N-terminal cleavage/methylation domain-containing protein
MTRRGFSLIELLVVVAIVAVLAGMLMPALAAVRRAAHSARCQSALRQVALAGEAYAGEWDGLVVPVGNPAGNYAWGPLLAGLLDESPAPALGGGRSTLWGCPAWRGNYALGALLASAPGYGSNRRPAYPASADANDWGGGAGARAMFRAGITHPSFRLWFADWNDWQINWWSLPSADAPTVRVQAGWTPAGGARHSNGLHLVCFDGHAVRLGWDQARQAITDPASLP